MNRRPLIWLLLTTLLVAVTACNQRPTPVDEATARAYAQEVDPIVETTLTGLSEGDYEQHARYFDEDMRDRVDEVVVFPQVYQEVIGTVGEYQSHELRSVEDQNLYRIVTYDVTFENDPDVTAQFIFWQNDDAHKITGLWFNSPRLRERN